MQLPFIIHQLYVAFKLHLLFSIVAGLILICCDLCSVLHSQCYGMTWIVPPIWSQGGGGHHIMQQHHVYSVAGTTSSVRMTLQIKWGTGGGAWARRHGNVHFKSQFAMVWLGPLAVDGSDPWPRSASVSLSFTNTSEWTENMLAKNSLLCVINNASTLE